MSILESLGKVIDFTVKNEDNILKAIKYFKRYGYLSKVKEGKVEDVLNAVRRFQSMTGVKETGIIDGHTLKIMDYPRCSLPDFEPEIENASTGDNLRWSKKQLTYFIQSYDGDMTKDLWFATIRKAFDNISLVCDLDFEQVDNINEANLILGMGQGSRDDFDGSSGTLAWFQLPNSYNFAGRLQGKFDKDEFWLGLNQNGRGIFLLNVSTHEILHGLGLRHSRISKALMAPIYSPVVAVPQDNDDKPRLVNLYGTRKIIVPPAVTPVPVPVPSGDLVISIKGNIESLSIPGYRLIKTS